MNDKERVYDEKIYPLMDSIIKICKEHQIPMFSVFQFTLDDTCVSLFGIPYVSKPSLLMSVLYAVYECKEPNGCFNIDKFLFWLLKQPGAETSLFLRQYVKDRDVNKQTDIK